MVTVVEIRGAADERGEPADCSKARRQRGGEPCGRSRTTLRPQEQQVQRPGGTQRDVFQEQEDQALGPGVERGRLQVGHSGCVPSQRVLVFCLKPSRLALGRAEL